VDSQGGLDLLELNGLDKAWFFKELERDTTDAVQLIAPLIRKAPRDGKTFSQ
jgi:hypothetical protein